MKERNLWLELLSNKNARNSKNHGILISIGLEIILVFGNSNHLERMRLLILDEYLSQDDFQI